MPYNTDRFKRLLKGYYDGSLTSVEYEEFWQLANDAKSEHSFQEAFLDFWKETAQHPPIIADKEWDEKMQHLKSHFESPSSLNSRRHNLFYLTSRQWVAVLVGLIVMSSSFYLWNLSTHPNPHNFTQKKAQPLPVKDLKPGSNKAMLVLADGSTILLDDSENGLLAMQGKTNIIKQQDGQITYKAGAANATEMVYNTLSTPRGGQFKISLPDGTKVWLNASSTLKYPVEFLGKERKVEISGEAYFEVAKDPSKPFLVETNQEMIEVLGTHFNVNNYGDEDLVKTTLLEGSINLKVDGGNSLLRPGQQAQLSKTGNLKVTNYVDLEEIIAWKEGNFQFEDETIKSIMRQIARWYDVDVEFRGQVNKRFGGVISRNVELSKVLNMLQMTGEVKLTIQGKKVIVEEP